MDLRYYKQANLENFFTLYSQLDLPRDRHSINKIIIRNELLVVIKLQ